MPLASMPAWARSRRDRAPRRLIRRGPCLSIVYASIGRRRRPRNGPPRKADMPIAKSLDLLDDLLKRARKAGAQAADAVFVEGAALSIAERLGKPEKLERAEGRD